MDHLTNRSEQIISELVQEHNDEQVVRVIFALLDLDQGKVQERVDLLTQLLQYPLTDRRNEENPTRLPASPNTGHSNRTIPNRSSGFALGERYVLLAVNRSLHQDPDELVRSWYEEAIACYSYAIRLIPTGGAYLRRALVYFIQSRHEEALADCKQALHLNSELNTQAVSGK